MDLINIFRFEDDGRLTEEFVRTDCRSLLRQLGRGKAPGLIERRTLDGHIQELIYRPALHV